MSTINQSVNRTGAEIAIIGLAGRFPGAKNIEDFWQNLKNGVESISFMSDEELNVLGLDAELLNNPNYVKSKGSIIEDKELFDAFFFDYTPGEAEIMDPQMRILHECTFEALENAGYNPGRYNGIIGFYAGASFNSYWEGLVTFSGKKGEHGAFITDSLVGRDFLTTRISYKLNLKGPSFLVQSACSTSLVAVHLGCQAILNGECHIALAGGVKIEAHVNKGYLFQEGMILSQDGHCRAFDAKANGTSGGQGVAVVVLKLLEDAILDRDYIHAIIKGTAVNNDGKDKIGYTTPGINGQTAVIQACHQTAEVNPESISYIETHGTATDLGDPAEIEALKLAFNTTKKGFCAIGSVKTNIGHLDAAAGLTGLIKTVLALKHKLIPPSLHYENPNPKIDFENSPFFVNTRLTPWKNDSYPLRAGVSAFGIGGTNAHVVLEEWINDRTLNASDTSRERLLLWSAKTKTALDKMTVNLAEYFLKNPDIDIADAAYTLQIGRRGFNYRRMLVCHDIKEAVTSLTEPGSADFHTFFNQRENRPVVFMFSGQGSQYANMGLGIYQTQPVFREEMDRCFGILSTLTNQDIKNILYPPDAKNMPLLPPLGINDTEIAQPLLFTFEYALAKLLMSWNIMPYAMVGHSIGEYVAACLSGVFSLEDALKIVVLRGKLMQRLPRGSMLGVPLSEGQLVPLLNDNISLAAVNSSSHCVVSGSHEAIDEFEKKLKTLEYNSTRLHTSHAFHSSMMDPILEDFEKILQQTELKKPILPYISNLTGDWITGRDATNTGYWAKHLRSTVRFSQGLENLFKEEYAIFVEIGPGKSLVTFARQHNNKKDQQVMINLIRHPGEEIADHYYLLNKTGLLWLYGKEIDWNKFYTGETCSRIPVPTYPFERQRYWIDENEANVNLFSQQSLSPKKKNIEDWLYIPSWLRSPVSPYDLEEINDVSIWLVFADDTGLATQLLERLNSEGKSVVLVNAGPDFSKISDTQYVLNPKCASDYRALCRDLTSTKKIPSMIVHLWGVSNSTVNEYTYELFNHAQYLGFLSMLFLVQALAHSDMNNQIKIVAITNNMQEVNGQEYLSPEKATVLGPIKVIPQEHPNIKCRSIDILLPKPVNGLYLYQDVVEQLLIEFSDKSWETVVAYRGNQRWVQTYNPFPIKGNPKSGALLKEKGVYLITGGLGKIGMVLAEYLANTLQARLVLTGRSGFPGKDQWEQWLNSQAENDPISLKIRKLQKFEALGAKILIYEADVTDQQRMQQILMKAEQEFGPLNGVIHAAVAQIDSIYAAVDDTTLETSQINFQSKIAGLLVLEKVVYGKQLDFCVLMSSLSAVLGGLGFAAYAAANLFMDSFALRHNQANPNRWTSINWDGWNFSDKKETNPEELSILPEEGIEIFKHVLSWHQPSQIIVSTGDIGDRIDKWLKFEAEEEPSETMDIDASQELSPLHQRPNLSTPYIPPHNPLEQELVNIWQTFFGIEGIGINDDFFELGGDSLKAITMLGRIHKKLNVKIPLVDLFKNPSIEKMAKFIAKSDENRYVSIQPTEKKEYYILSSAQKRIYFIQQLEGQNTAYNITVMVEIDGRLDQTKLASVFKKLIQRHDSFRTSFKMIEGEPFQQIHDHVDFEIEYYNGNDKTKDKVVKEFIRPFNLSQAPLLRVGLMTFSEEKFLLMADKHHIITDGVSFTVFVRDFISFYLEKDIPELKLQYHDYAEWQHNNIQSEEMKNQEKYWLEKFKGEIPVLNLPTDFVRPSVQLYDGNSILAGELGNSETDSLKKIIKEKGTTMHVFLLAVFNIMLFKYTNQEDIVVGITSAGRVHSDLDTIIGMFVNMLALRNFPSPKKTFTDFLGEVNDDSLKAYQNQDFQFDQLIEKLKLKRETSRNPLFDVVFIFQGLEVFSTSQVGQLETSDIRINPYMVEYNKAKYDLLLNANETKTGMHFSFNYRTTLFMESSIETMGRYLENIISEVIKNPAIKLADIKMVSDADELNILKNLKQQKNITSVKNKDLSTDRNKKKEANFNF